MAFDLRQYLALQTNKMLRSQQGHLQFINSMAHDLPHSDIKGMLQTHGQLLQQQINNLEEISARLGEIPQAHKGFLQQLEGSMGGVRPEGSVTQVIMSEYRDFIDTLQPGQQLIFLNAAITADMTLHLEMAGYTHLISLAKFLGEEGFAATFQENLRLEQRMCSDLEGMIPNLLEQTGQGRSKAA